MSTTLDNITKLIVKTPARVPVPASLAIKWVTAYALGLSVLALVLLHRLPVSAYVDYVVGPGLIYLGLHTAAKTLN